MLARLQRGYDSRRTSYILAKLTSIYRQGWEMRKEGKNIKYVLVEPKLPGKRTRYYYKPEGHNEWFVMENETKPTTKDCDYGRYFVDMETSEQADAAIKALNGYSYVPFELSFTSVPY